MQHDKDEDPNGTGGYSGSSSVYPGNKEPSFTPFTSGNVELDGGYPVDPDDPNYKPSPEIPNAPNPNPGDDRPNRELPGKESDEPMEPTPDEVPEVPEVPPVDPNRGW